MDWKRYVVCDEDGNVSWNPKTDSAQTFKKFRGPNGAEARAKELADCAPGQAIRIYEFTAEVIAPVKAAETSRRHPTEHYK